MELLAAYLHQIAILVLAALLAAEFLLCNDEIQPGHVALLARVDLGFLGAAVLAFVTGVARLAGPGLWPHLAQPLFWLKVLLFFVLGGLSVMPTLQFMRWSRAIALGEERVLGRAELRRVRRILAAELAIVAAIPLISLLVARATTAH